MLKTDSKKKMTQIGSQKIRMQPIKWDRAEKACGFGHLHVKPKDRLSGKQKRIWVQSRVRYSQTVKNIVIIRGVTGLNPHERSVC